ncbi:hypothetical protein EVAR_31636_1 [Eumeta japonica]|uniref:Uncharacterized protein n=1 Tax=Eumeta variegata TaxID=151549 RepID=A0A4C1W0V9_EUMVA|nr:hypothetical protein EVAR_31636_1 [Eumeta japonica]
MRTPQSITPAPRSFSRHRPASQTRDSTNAAAYEPGGNGARCSCKRDDTVLQRDCCTRVARRDDGAINNSNLERVNITTTEKAVVGSASGSPRFAPTMLSLVNAPRIAVLSLNRYTPYSGPLKRKKTCTCRT